MVGRVALMVLVALGVGACSTNGPSPSPSGGGSGSASNPPSPSSADVVGTALTFVQAIAAGDGPTAEALESQQLAAAAPYPMLKQIWDQLVAASGPYQRIGPVATAAQPPFQVVTVTVEFEHASVPLLVTVSSDGKVGGLHLGQPIPEGSSSPAAWSPATYVDASTFTDSEITVGEAPWALQGTLSMPKDEGPVPAVVLLAGSGPQDRDETIGPNKPLADLAGGLASSGIATLRYDKRTKVYGAQMAADPTHLTVEEETIEDAIAAVALARQTPGIDPDRVFVVGHSLGALLAPRIAKQAGGTVAGIGLLEGNTTPLQDLIVRQLEYLASPDGGSDPQSAAMLPKIRDQVALVNSPELSLSTPSSELPFGSPAAYWLDLREYEPATTAASLSIPMFITQGGRDYQVPPSELEGWRTALADRSNVTIKEYPALNHLLIAGSGPSRPAEYALAGHVDAAVIDDLAAWVKAS